MSLRLYFSLALTQLLRFSSIRVHLVLEAWRYHLSSNTFVLPVLSYRGKGTRINIYYTKFLAPHSLTHTNTHTCPCPTSTFTYQSFVYVFSSLLAHIITEFLFFSHFLLPSCFYHLLSSCIFFALGKIYYSAALNANKVWHCYMHTHTHMHKKAQASTRTHTLHTTCARYVMGKEHKTHAKNKNKIKQKCVQWICRFVRLHSTIMRTNVQILEERVALRCVWV